MLNLTHSAVDDMDHLQVSHPDRYELEDGGCILYWESWIDSDEADELF